MRRAVDSDVARRPLVARNREHRRALIAMLAQAGTRYDDDSDEVAGDARKSGSQTGALAVARTRGHLVGY